MYFKIEQDENKNYEIRMTDKFYNLMYPFYSRGSYFNIFYRLFNLLPKDFYHYVGFHYHAQFQKSKYLRYVKMTFKKELDAKNFYKELERRFLYCVNRGDFN
jgi:hypothetical protein